MQRLRSSLCAGRYRRGFAEGATHGSMISRVERQGQLPSRHFEKLHAWYRDMNRLKYLSDFERGLSRSLWGLLLIALVYAISQHVLLANVPEAFPGGARLGVVCYDLAIAYTGAFTFYLLNIRLPLRRDRRYIYQHLAKSIDLVVSQPRSLMGSLNNAAGFNTLERRENSLANVEETCKLLTLNSDGRAILPAPYHSGSEATVMDVINYNIGETRARCRDVLDFTSFLASDVIKYLYEIENCYFMVSFEERVNLQWALPMHGDQDLSYWAKYISEYLEKADLLHKYRLKFLPKTPYMYS